MHRRHPISLLLTAMPALPPGALSLPNEPLEQVDLARYVGVWHEIAHLPMYYQRNCVDRVTATYTPRADGTLTVHNACRNCSGDTDSALGIARRVKGQPGALQVRFAPAWLSWLPLVWADYWIIELDVDYQWAVVGSPSRKYLWVLSRTPSMSPELFERLRLRSGLRGYPVEKLIIAGGLD
ncbi:lipocalin family protein [Dyella sp. C9]|uniref:lipocalin family protein n=1 Tax=Dyella sp. C9 TaxID=2202154 RepID=UPI000DEEBBD2|nr:lipocalin family protein [Dyella sp. C9]